MDPVKAVFKTLKQEQRHEVEPHKLFMAIYMFCNEYVPVRIEKFGPRHEGQCGMTYDGQTIISISPGTRTAGGRARKASVLVHEMVHAIKHYGVGHTVSSSKHPGIDRGMFSPWELIDMEMEAELNAYAVMSAFTSHPYVRNRSMNYVRVWNRTLLDDLSGFVDEDLIEFLTNEIEKRL